MFRAIAGSIILIIIVTQLPVIACCASILNWDLKDMTFINGDDPSISFTVCKYSGGSFDEICKDTVYQSEMLSDLKQSYDRSASVVVASISNAKEFALEPDEEGIIYYAESVSVKIEKVIKGTIDKGERTVVSSIDGKSLIYIYNDTTEEFIPVYSIRSLKDPGYKAIEGRKFLLFLNKNECSARNLTIQKPEPCVSQMFRYLVDNSNKVYFDGLEIDSITNKIKRVSKLTVELDKVMEFFSNSTSVQLNKKPIKQVRSSKYHAYCDLMGKRVLMNNSDRHISGTRPIISFDEGCKNRIKMTLR